MDSSLFDPSPPAVAPDDVVPACLGESHLGVASLPEVLANSLEDGSSTCFGGPDEQPNERTARKAGRTWRMYKGLIGSPVLSMGGERVACRPWLRRSSSRSAARSRGPRPRSAPRCTTPATAR